MSILSILERGARLSRGRPAVIAGDVEVRYADFTGLVRSAALRLIAAGVRRREHAAVLSPNDPNAFAAALGVMAAGAAYLPLNPKGSAAELAGAVRRLDCQALFYHPECAEVAAAASAAAPRLRLLPVVEPGRESGGTGGPELPVPSLDDIAWLGQTGGTTGAPKGVQLSWRAIYAFLEKYLIELPEERPTMLAATPMTHAAGMLALPTLARGGSVVMMEKLELEPYLAAIARHRVTTTFLPPTAIYRLLDLPGVRSHDLSSLKYLIYGSAPMSVERLKSALEVFGPVMTQLYGQTECHSIISVMRPEDHFQEGVRGGVVADDRRLASCGRPSLGTLVEIRDEEGRALPPGEPGEIAVMSDIRMSGYYKDPEETARVLREGFVHTGDIGALDADGFLRIVDRKKDLVISGGLNIYPSEVEQALQSHPAVADCAVVGLPHADWGEAVTAVVQLRPGCEASPDALVAHVRRELGPVKTPKALHVWEDLPRSPIGKVLKGEVRARLKALATPVSEA